MKETGQVAVFNGPGKDFDLKEFPLPEIEPGAILVKVAAAGICGSDLHIWRGDMGDRGTFQAGSPMGHEMMGRVHRLGVGVSTDSLGRSLKEGDRIAYTYFYPCRNCVICGYGDYHACPYRTSGLAPIGEPPYFTGAFGEYYYLRPGHFVFKVPDQLSDAMVAPVNCAFCEVAFGLQRADVQFGDTVVIQGAGGLGLYAVSLAREMGAAKVIAIDGQSARLQMAGRMGADELIDLQEHPTSEARIARVKELTGGLGADLVVGLVGFAPAFIEGIKMVRPAGKHLEIGSISQVDAAPIIPASIVFGRVNILGIGLYDPWIIPKVLDFMVRNLDRYPFSEIVSNEYRLSDINRAFRESEWKQNGQSAVTRSILVMT